MTADEYRELAAEARAKARTIRVGASIQGLGLGRFGVVSPKGARVQDIQDALEQRAEELGDMARTIDMAAAR